MYHSEINNKNDCAVAIYIGSILSHGIIDSIKNTINSVLECLPRKIVS